jgi:hypothetical protein
MTSQLNGTPQSLRRRLGARVNALVLSGLVLALCTTLAAAASGNLAFGADAHSSTQGGSSKALKEALGRANRALAVANQALAQSGRPGPRGEQGFEGVAGQNGAAGSDGATILSGTTVPNSALGHDGDFYLRTNTSEIYGPKSGGFWGSPTSLKGADGGPGPPGAPGPAGVNGQPWTPDNTLPSGATLKGDAVIPLDGSGNGTTAISFPIPLAAPVPADNVHKIDLNDLANNGPPAGCTFDFDTLSIGANSGQLCIMVDDSVGFGVFDVSKLSTSDVLGLGNATDVGGAKLTVTGATANATVFAQFAVSG